MAVTADTTAGEASALASEWRRDMRTEVDGLRHEIGSVSDSVNKLAVTVERVSNHVAGLDQDIASIRARPAAARDWTNMAIAAASAVMSAIGSGCGCVTLLASLVTVLGAIAAVLIALHL